jgi:carboxylesterase type B
MIIGNTSHDTAATIRGAAIPDPKASREEVVAWEREILQIYYGKDPDLVEMAQKAYGLHGEPNDVSTYPPYGTPQQQIGTDLDHRCGTVLSASLHAAIAPTWMFEFSRTTPGHLPTHGAELRYLFASDDLEDAAARRQSDIMQGYWTNFAKNGDPNGPGLPPWAKYDAIKKQSLEFTNDGPITRTDMRALACAPYIEKYRRDPKPLTGGTGTYIRGPAITR